MMPQENNSIRHRLRLSDKPFSVFHTFVILLVAIQLVSCSSATKSVKTATTGTYATPQKPNIIIIYVDDLGYGDLGCYGAKGVATPNVDTLAKNGIRFTDAHCSAATCTPSRFSLLTGSYAFRNEVAILPGDAPLLINPNTPTLPGMLQKAGYTTGVVGKWHLGLGSGYVNWNKKITPGPAEIGFNYSFLIPATGDRVPCVFVENQQVVNLNPNDSIQVSYQAKIGNEPTGTEHPELLKMKADPQHSNSIVNNISRIGFMAGGKDARWVDEDFPFVLVRKASEFIKNNQKKPFFLYLAYHDIHVPRIPNKQFVGKSTMGPRGDAIAQMDWCTGQIVRQLKKLGLDQNTLIIFSSDNGPVLDDGYDDKAVQMLGDHKPAGIFRGGKYSAYEGGTRVPTIVHWPLVIQPTESAAMWNHVDIYATIAALIGQPLASTEAPDSENMLPLLLGSSKTGRDVMLEESFTMAVRKGEWKYIAPATKSPSWMKNKKTQSGLGTQPQLYHIQTDMGENTDVAAQYPDKVKEMQVLLENIRKEPTRK